MSDANPPTGHVAHRRFSWVGSFYCEQCGGYGQSTSWLARGVLRLGWVEHFRMRAGIRAMFDRIEAEHGKTPRSS